MPRTKQAPSRKKAENGNQVQTPSAVFATAPAEDEVRRRAYEIYEARGRQDGGAVEDWIRAEQELLAHNGRSTL